MYICVYTKTHIEYKQTRYLPWHIQKIWLFGFDKRKVSPASKEVVELLIMYEPCISSLSVYCVSAWVAGTKHFMQCAEARSKLVSLRAWNIKRSVAEQLKRSHTKQQHRYKYSISIFRIYSPTQNITVSASKAVFFCCFIRSTTSNTDTDSLVVCGHRILSLYVFFSISVHFSRFLAFIHVKMCRKFIDLSNYSFT